MTPTARGYARDGREDLHPDDILYVVNAANSAILVFEEEGKTKADDKARNQGCERDVKPVWAAREARRNGLGHQPEFRHRVGILDVRLLEFLVNDLIGGIRCLHIQLQLLELSLDPG